MLIFIFYHRTYICLFYFIKIARILSIPTKYYRTDLRYYPFVVEKINKGKDLADIFFEFHLKAVNITSEECGKYNITRDEADTIINIIKSFATEMHNQKLNGTLVNFDKGFPKEVLKYNSKDNYHKLVLITFQILSKQMVKTQSITP